MQDRSVPDTDPGVQRHVRVQDDLRPQLAASADRRVRSDPRPLADAHTGSHHRVGTNGSPGAQGHIVGDDRRRVDTGFRGRFLGVQHRQQLRQRAVHVPDHDPRGQPGHAVGERVRDEDHTRPSAGNIGQVARIRKKGEVLRTGAVKGGDARDLRVFAPLQPAAEQRCDRRCPHGSASPRRDCPPAVLSLRVGGRRRCRLSQPPQDLVGDVQRGVGGDDGSGRGIEDHGVPALPLDLREDFLDTVHDRLDKL